MKVGDLVQYTRDLPTSFAEFQNGVRQNDIGLIVDTLRNGTTVKVRWLKNNDELSMGKKNLEVGSILDYERLAINETVLVYRLANSLKSKDRLTQKDIQMAKELVKVFPFFRGDESVTAALVAVGETILDDIKQQETVYLKAGGSSEYLLRERRQYNLISPEATFDDLNGLDTTFQERKKSLKDLSQEGFHNATR